MLVISYRTSVPCGWSVAQVAPLYHQPPSCTTQRRVGSIVTKPPARVGRRSTAPAARSLNPAFSAADSSGISLRNIAQTAPTGAATIPYADHLPFDRTIDDRIIS